MSSFHQFLKEHHPEYLNEAWKTGGAFPWIHNVPDEMTPEEQEMLLQYMKQGLTRQQAVQAVMNDRGVQRPSYMPGAGGQYNVRNDPKAVNVALGGTEDEMEPRRGQVQLQTAKFLRNRGQ